MALDTSDCVMPSEFLNVCGSQNPQSFSVFHLNARSAVAKTADLELLFTQLGFDFDTVMLTETWYTEHNNVFKLPLYDSHFINRTNSRGGGVLLMVKKHFQSEVLHEFSFVHPDYEVLSLVIERKVVAVIYRPPSGNLKSFFSFLDFFLSFISENKYDVILGGDFNINFLVDNPTKIEFENLLNSFAVQNVISNPTRVTLQSESLIDLFITNTHMPVLNAGVINTDISDHRATFMCIPKSKFPNRKVTTKLFRDISTKKLNTFKEEVNSHDWSDVLNETAAERAYALFLTAFLRIYNKCFPYKHAEKRKNIRKPWITPELLKKIRKKDKLYKKFEKTRDPDIFKAFKVFRNKLTTEIRRARDQYFCDKFSSMNKSDELWRKLNALLGRSSGSSPITTIQNGGKELTGIDLANAFNSHFTDITSNFVDSNTLNTRNEKSMFLTPISESEVISVFMGLNNSKSADADDIVIKPVKYVIEDIAGCLTQIYNLCLSQGLFPKQMQLAKVSVLHKKGSKNEFTNFRPVSILPVFSKGFEKMILSRITNFSEQCNILHDAQYGFRKHRSTEMALLEQKEFVLESLENKEVALGVYVDFTKAFDYLNHSILLKKLEMYGFRGTVLSLLTSYLNDRNQYVYLNGYSSHVLPISAGVPQGSILGPFLFNLYLNDIISIDPTVKFVIYADDVTLLFTAASADEVITRANKTLEKLDIWAQLNKLKINVSKTKAVLYRAKNKIISIDRDIKLNNSKIEIVNTFKILGVYFTENMTWDNHVSHVISKLSCIVGVTYANRYTLPPKVKLLLYNALFHSHINYCQLVWGNTTKGNLQKILTLQKKMLRNIENVPRSHPSHLLFSKYCIMKIDSLYSHGLCSRYRIEIKNNTHCLLRLASLCKRTLAYEYRSTQPWLVKTCRTDYGRQMINRLLPHLLNICYRNGITPELTSKRELKLLFIENNSFI